jgi:phage replication-related protein YjqB (UPF0714/DUF867 family)
MGGFWGSEAVFDDKEALDMLDRYHSYAELALREIDGKDYEVTAVQRSSPIAILALHAGGIEPGTSEIARALAGDRYSLYMFEGLKGSGGEYLHITSTHFDEPRALALVKSAEWGLSLHGCMGEQPMVYLGGRDTEHIPMAITLLKEAGFDASSHNHRFSAANPANLCNRGRSGMGLQLELTKGLRRSFFQDLDRRAGRQHQTEQFNKFLIAIQQIVSKIEIEMIL